ncbi:hypothetical protein ACFV9C_41480 [Kribbella sp. NPDC059898]|uniref:hypothetical protein n=1 Tax=Kribbella sp. NPDC059898 TaxID=3346995 RepID=UPI00365F4230
MAVMNMMSAVETNYPDVRHVEVLPKLRASDSKVVTPGFAVEIHGPRVPAMRVFFQDLEPALAFGRAARMACGDVNGYGVLKALRVTEWNETTRSDATTLYTTGGNLDRRPDEHAALRRWLDGVSVESSHFRPPTV